MDLEIFSSFGIGTFSDGVGEFAGCAALQLYCESFWVGESLVDMVLVRY